MIEKEDYRKYLSVDNGKGLLLKQDDIYILEKYHINYKKYSSLKDLIFIVGEYMDDYSEDGIEDLEAVLIHLQETYYYYEVKK